MNSRKPTTAQESTRPRRLPGDHVGDTEQESDRAVVKGWVPPTWALVVHTILGAVILAVVVILALTGCSSSGGGSDGGGSGTHDTTSLTPTTTREDPTGPDGSDVPQVGTGTGLADTDYVEIDNDALNIGLARTRDPVNDDDPADVLVRGLTAGLNWRPASDSTQFDSFARAASAFNNTYLRDQETRLATLVPMSMADWTAWGDAQQVFFPQVRITNEDHPADTATDFSRVVVIDMRTGLQSAPEIGREVFTIIAQARVHRSELGWRIDSFDVRQSLVGDTPDANASAGSTDAGDATGDIAGDATGAGER